MNSTLFYNNCSKRVQTQSTTPAKKKHIIPLMHPELATEPQTEAQYAPDPEINDLLAMDRTQATRALRKISKQRLDQLLEHARKEYNELNHIIFHLSDSQTALQRVMQTLSENSGNIGALRQRFKDLYALITLIENDL